MPVSSLVYACSRLYPPFFCMLKPSFSIFHRRRPPWLHSSTALFSVTGKDEIPLEAGGLGLGWSVGVPGVWLAGFLALDDVEGVMAPLGVDVIDVVDPTEGLCDGGVFAGAMDEGPCLAAEFVELFVDAGQLAVLQGDEEFPMMFAAQAEDGPIGEQAVEEKHEGETRETGFEAFGQTVKRFEFAVLLGDVFSGVYSLMMLKANPLGHTSLASSTLW